MKKLKTKEMKNYYLRSIVLFSFLIAFTSCEGNDEPEILAPIITSQTTSENVEVDYTTIKINGNISLNGANEITARGVCWDTSPNPTISNDKTTEVSNTFTSTISNLVANTTYYFRVYATNSAGTNYSAEQSYETSSLDATTWDFLIKHPRGSWNADVIFNADGTTVYDEPSSPGTYLTNGTWSLSENILTYDLDSSDPKNTEYQFTGTLLNNTMSGTYTFGTSPDRTWSATKY